MTTFSVSYLTNILLSQNTVYFRIFFCNTDREVQEDFRGGDRSGSRVAAGRIYKIFVEATWSRTSDINYKDTQFRSNAQVQHAGTLYLSYSPIHCSVSSPNFSCASITIPSSSAYRSIPTWSFPFLFQLFL